MEGGWSGDLKTNSCQNGQYANKHVPKQVVMKSEKVRRSGRYENSTHKTGGSPSQKSTERDARM